MRAMRTWIGIDLLLTAPTITDALKAMRARRSDVTEAARPPEWQELAARALRIASGLDGRLSSGALSR